LFDEANENNKVRVRVRGIYATALTKMLVDRGFTVVQASRVIRDRFKSEFSTEAADVTIKDVEEDPSTIMVIGYPKHVQLVLDAILPELKYYILWRSKIGLYSIVKGKVINRNDNECIVELPHGVKGVLRNCNFDVGSSVVCSVVRTAIKDYEHAILSDKIRVVGDYAIMIHNDNRISVSEHIRNHGKISLLLMLAQKYQREGYGVHWRSSSGYAPIDTLSKELEILKNKLDSIIKNLGQYPTPSIIEEGEQLAFVTLTRPAKEMLDNIRSKVIATIHGHHMFKSVDRNLSNYVDLLEYLVSRNRANPEDTGKGLLEYCIEQLKSKDRIEIIHIKPDGTKIRLTPGVIDSIEYLDNDIKIVVKRVFRKPGVYDGLQVAKELGDYDLMEIRYNSWLIIHNYYSKEGKLKGTYININTPPELSTTRIVYHDLILDVVKKPEEEEYKLLDVDEFIDVIKRNIISKDIASKIVEEVKEKIGLDLTERLDVISNIVKT